MAVAAKKREPAVLRRGGRLRWSTAGALLVTAVYAVVVARGSVAGLGGPDDTLYQSGLHQIMATAFLHVAVALIAFWLVVLRRTAGYALAAALGLFTLLIYAVALSAPPQAGPPLLPPWVHGVGILAAVVMLLGGIQRLARRGAG